MSFDELYILGYNGIVKVLNYFNSVDKRIFYLYLLSSLFLAYYVYYKLKVKYSFLKYIFSKKIWLSQSSFVDYFMIFFNSFIKILLIGPYIYYGLYLAYHTDEYLSHTFGLVDNALSKIQIMVLYTIVLTLTNDLSTYLVHLIMHKIPFLWEFHKIHHSATVLNPITQYRIHPVELFINNAKAILIFGLTAGLFDYLSVNQVQEWQYLGANVFSFIFLFWGANLRHSHVKLKYFTWLENIFISPFQHQIHHSNNKDHFNKNMGAKLAIWDWLFGTLLKSKSVGKIEFGLGKEDNKNYDSFIKNLYMPFLNIFKRVMNIL
jgi:sterol desaturase/sphingolipid hydroxylase (fatty acid hydroxylase superfamily)